MSELIQIQPYSEKSFVLIGNTKPHKDEIKGLGGRWNSRLRDGMKAWIFSNTRKEKVEEFLKTLYPHESSSLGEYPEEKEEEEDTSTSIDKVQKEIKFYLDKVEELKKTLSSLQEKELHDIIHGNDSDSDPDSDDEDEAVEIPLRTVVNPNVVFDDDDSDDEIVLPTPTKKKSPHKKPTKKKSPYKKPTKKKSPHKKSPHKKSPPRDEIVSSRIRIRRSE